MQKRKQLKKQGIQMLKKIAKLACLSCFAFSGALVADQPMQGSTAPKQGPEIYDGGFTAGLTLRTSVAGSDSSLTLGYINNWFLCDICFDCGNKIHYT